LFGARSTLSDFDGSRHNARNISAPLGHEQRDLRATKWLFARWVQQNLFDDHRVSVRNLASTSPQHRGTTMQTETMNVTGMTCGGCVSKVTQALKAVPGVGHVEVSLPGKASVDFDEKLTSRERLQSAVKDAGYGIASEEATASRTKGGCCG
jgi:copper chaperone